jgi:hypothetical protein
VGAGIGLETEAALACDRFKWRHSIWERRAEHTKPGIESTKSFTSHTCELTSLSTVVTIVSQVCESLLARDL